MRIRLGVPTDASDDEKEHILNAALESVTRADEAELARGLPSFGDALAAGRVRWRPEPPGDEHFDLGSTVLRRGWGDCDDIAPYAASSLRANGVDPDARAIVQKSGPNRWHAVVRRSNGRIEDPSRAAGMGTVSGLEQYGGPFWPAMFQDQMAMAAMPYPGGWAARVDVPSMQAPFVYSPVQRGQSAASAIVGACAGALSVCGDDLDDYDELLISGLHDLLCGVPPREVGEAAEQCGYDGVGFLAALAPAAMSLAAPLANKIMPGLFPGGGGATPAPSGGGGGGGGFPSGSTMHCPGGPIIVRF